MSFATVRVANSFIYLKTPRRAVESYENDSIPLSFNEVPVNGRLLDYFLLFVPIHSLSILPGAHSWCTVKAIEESESKAVCLSFRMLPETHNTNIR